MTFGETPGSNHRMVTRDVYLNSNSIGHNYGGAAFVSVGDTPLHTGLLRFELSALSPSTVVAGATLYLSTEQPLSSGIVELYEVVEEWSEGNKAGGSSVASWTDRIPGAAWTTSGALAPGSRATLVLASIAPTDANAREAISVSAAGLALVQRWVDDPASNFGVALAVTSGGGAWTFTSRESAKQDARPVLELAIE